MRPNQMTWIVRLLCLCSLLFVTTLACDPPVECKENADCSGTNQVCTNNKCVEEKPPECSKDTDCISPEICKEGKCIPPPCPEKETPGGCCLDTDCQSGEACVEKKCQAKAKPCATDDECKAADEKTPKCLDSKCVAADLCNEDKDCKDPAKPSCKESKCQESDDAQLGEECDVKSCADKLVCYAEVGTPYCRESCDPFNSVCRGGTVCAAIGTDQGVCLPRNNGKLEGDSCVSDSCERDLFCVDWTSKLCVRPCRPDKTDCGANDLCRDFGNVHLCVPEPPKCGAGRPCDGKWTCDEKKGICVPDSCPTKACKSGEICRLGSCVEANCCKGDPCASGNVCNHQSGKCVSLEIRTPFCTSCLSGGNCAQPSQRCIQLTGADDKLCAEECTATKTCQDPLMECIEQSDKKAFCLPRSKTCQRDRCDGVTCKDGEACLPATKKCVPVGLDVCKPCTDNLQCGGPSDRCIIKQGETTGYCAKDCSGCAKCDKGYTCKDFEGGKQCLPNSGTCQ